MVVIYVVAGNIAGIALAGLTLMWGGSLIAAFLVYWLACTIVAVLVAMVYARVTARRERDTEENRGTGTQASRRAACGILRPVRSND